MENEDIKKLNIGAESLFNCLNFWLAIADSNLNMLVWNNIAQRESGYLREAVLGGKKAWELLYPDQSYRLELERKLLLMIRGEGQDSIDTIAFSNEALSRPISWMAIKGDSGQGEKLYLLGTDLSIHRVKQALARSEQKFRLFSDHLPGAAYIKNSEGQFLFFNDYFQKNFGWDTSMLVGKKNEDIWPGNPGSQLRKNDLEVLSRERSIMFEENLCINKQKRTFISYKFPIPGSEGILLGGVSLDITGMRSMENMLQKSREKFEETLKLLPDIVFETDSSGFITYLNSTGEKMLGKGKEDLGSFSLLEVIDKRDRKRVERELTGLMRGNARQAVLLEFKISGNGGKGIPVIGRIAPIAGNQAEIEGARGILVDTTELKQKEHDLFESEKRYRSLFDNSRDGIYISTLQGDYIDANPALVKMLGYSSKQELISKNISTDIYHDSKKRPSPDQRDKPFEAKFKKKDGTNIWVEISSRVIYRMGKPAFYQGIVRDISQRKKYEKELRYISFHDNLTGLYNRAYFEEELKRLDKERQLPLSIIIGDVNCLKLLNDAFGHRMGDSLLKKASGILKKACRKEDIVARWGGDEFAMLLPRTSARTADQVIMRIRDNASNCFLGHVPLSISLGRDTKNRVGENIQEVIGGAEDNMYRQKLLGKKAISTKVLQSLKKTLFEKSYYNHKHSSRVRKMAVLMGKALGFSLEDLDRLALIAVYHDIGKIAVSDHILNKEGPLSSQQFKQIKRHPEVGYNIAESIPQLSPIAEAILAHHERWDGKGYPQGLSQKEIPVLARMLSVVDAFDVMQNGCIYKCPMDRDKAIAELKRNSGSQFDPLMVETFLKILEQK